MKRNNILTLVLAFIASVILMSSCEDKIDVTLEDADAIVVIDAFLTDLPGELQKIYITKSQSYFDNASPIPVEDAIVSVGVTDVLIPFDYVNGAYQWQPDADLSLSSNGNSFELYVVIDEVTYTSTVELGRSPEIDEIRQEVKESEIGYIEGGTYCEFIARDFEGKGDTYWIKSFKNDVYLNKPEEINLAYDGGFDQGAESDGLIFIPPIREFINPVPDSLELEDEISPWAPGDICRVEIHSISNSTFAFMELVRDQLLNGQNGIFSEPLANSPSNITASDGSAVLGAFNVADVSSLELEIQ